MSALGLTVRVGATLGIIIDHSDGKHVVALEDGTLATTAHAMWQQSYERDEELAHFLRHTAHFVYKPGDRVTWHIGRGTDHEWVGTVEHAEFMSKEPNSAQRLTIDWGPERTMQVSPPRVHVPYGMTVAPYEDDGEFVNAEEDFKVPDTLPWDDEEQDYYRQGSARSPYNGRIVMTEHGWETDMPEFRDDDGTMWIWDASSKTYVKASEGQNDPYVSDATGGDNDLFNRFRHTEKPANPTQTGILAARFDACPECGNPLNDAGECEHCNDIKQETPLDVNVQWVPFQERVPKPSTTNRDDSFPSRIDLSHTKRTDTTPVRSENSGEQKMRNFAHVNEEIAYREANKPSLDECPDCAGPMKDKDGDKVCRQCGTKQPIINVEAKEASVQKRSFVQALLLPLIEGLGAMAAEGGAAAAGTAAAEGGAAAGAAGGATEAGMAGKLMSGAMKPGNAMGMLKNMGNMGGLAPKLPQMPETPAATLPGTEHAPTTAAASDDEVFSDEDDEGQDDHPEFEHTDGFQEAVGDSPELLKDVDGGGGSLHFNQQDEAMTAFKHTLPMVLFYADNDEDGSDHPILKALDDMMEAAFPGYKGDDHGKDDKKDSKPKEKAAAMSLTPQEVAEQQMAGQPGEPCRVCGAVGPCPHKPGNAMGAQPAPGIPGVPGIPGQVQGSTVEARRPKMCPFHSNLVDYSRQIGPDKALSALAGQMFSERSCQGGFEDKCNFKAAMVTEEYWNEKEQAAQERREQREQEAQQAQLAEQQLEEQPGDQWEVEPAQSEAPAPDIADNVVQFPGHHPTTDQQESAVGGGEQMAVAASTHQSIVEAETDGINYGEREMHPHEPGADEGKSEDDPAWKDDQGQPLVEGSEYLLKAPDYAVPDKVTIVEVRPDAVKYRIHTDMMEYEDELSRQDIENGGYEFVQGDGTNEPDSSDGFDKAEHQAESDDQPHVELTTHQGAAPAMEEKEDGSFSTYKTAGKDFSPQEQRALINEIGTARNLDRLDIAGTHYEDEPDHSEMLSNSFIW